MVTLMQMNRLFVSILVLSGLVGIRAVGDEAALDGAREVFAAAVSGSLKIKRDAIQVIPVAIPSEVYSELTTGNLYAWTALYRDGKELVNGFAGLEEGTVSFAEYPDGGITELLKACHVLSRKERIPLDELVARIAFCLNRVGTGEIVYDPKLYKSSGFAVPDGVRKPAMHSQKSGEQFIYFTMIPGNTGTWEGVESVRNHSP